MDGTLTPDVFRVSRDTGSPAGVQPARKEVRLVMRPDSGTEIEPVPELDQASPSIDDARLGELARMGQLLESHYGAPQDIEWALDREGRLFLLQARPLKLVRARDPAEEPDLSGLKRILSGGTSVCPGAGSGTVYRAASSADLPGVPDDCVLVAPHPFPGLFAALGRVAALVTEVGGVASHLATLAREYGVPTIMGAPQARRLRPGDVVTVDATHGAIYVGAHPDVVEARKHEREAPQDNELLMLLERVLAHVVPAEPAASRRPWFHRGELPHLPRHHPLLPPASDAGDARGRPGARPPGEHRVATEERHPAAGQGGLPRPGP